MSADIAATGRSALPSIKIFIDGSYGLVTPGAYRTDLYVINASTVESVFLGTIHLARVLAAGLLANSTVRPPGQAAPSPRC